MHRTCGLTVFLVASLAVCAPLAATGNDETQRLDREFQAAVSQYNAGQFPEAARHLEKLVREVPESFEVHELLGLTYAAQDKNQEANVHFEKAVRLKPDSAPARTNLAVNLSHLGKLDLAEAQFKKAVEMEPRSFEPNHDFGEFYVRSGKTAAAVPYLKKAQELDPSSYENGYDLSLAYAETGQLDPAREQIHELVKQKDTAELHNLLGTVEEKSGDYVAAANEFQRAAHMDPSESNLFDWASELLLHRTLDPAIEVFKQGVLRYPDSARMALGLGIAHYYRGDYDDAVKALMKGTDLAPADPRAYYFLSKAYDMSPGQADEVIQRFHRFVQLQPANARSYYYYAMSQWKGKRTQDPDLNLDQIATLLKKSAELDAAFAEPHLQLGNVYSEQRKFPEAIAEYEHAVKLNPELADAHYRLGQAYVREGRRDRAQAEFQVYKQLHDQHMAELDKQRAEIRQFVYATKQAPSSKP